MSAQAKVKNRSQKFWGIADGYISKERSMIALLSTERPCVSKLHDVLTSQAFTRPIAVYGVDRKDVTIWGPGGRPWGLRGLAEAAGMCVNTVRYALRVLIKLNLIKAIANKLGTFIQVVNFFQYRRKNPNIGVTPDFDNGNSSTRQGDTPVSKIDTYRRDPNDLKRSIHSSVDVEGRKGFQPIKKIGKIISHLLDGTPVYGNC